MIWVVEPCSLVLEKDEAIVGWGEMVGGGVNIAR